MEIQEKEVEAPAETAAPRQIIHLQVAGDFSQEDLAALVAKFQETAMQGGVIATPNNVVANVITTTADIAGTILTPKMTALEIAEIAVDLLNSYDSQTRPELSAVKFSELEDDAKLEILGRIQGILRYGALLRGASNSEESIRDALFTSIVVSLGTKLAAPNMNNLISVTRLAQKEGDEDAEVNFKDLMDGDLFKHGDHKLVVQGSPYVNWIANPLPVVTIDAKVYQEPEPVAPEEVKASRATSKKKVQSKPSNSTAKSRKK
jgi:hypothetical protein